MPGKRLAGGTLQRTQRLPYDLLKHASKPLGVDRVAAMVRFVEPERTGSNCTSC